MGPCGKPLGPLLAPLLCQLSPLQRSVLRLTVLEGLRQGLVAHSHQSDSAP
jgi:DNA-directed RNA polymerase specialized sigma24 family protein